MKSVELHPSGNRRFIGCLEAKAFLDLMSEPIDALVLGLLEWIGPEPRPYREVIDAWRTSCPQLPVWEEAHARGYLEHHHSPGSEATVSVSALGSQLLAERNSNPNDPSNPCIRNRISAS